MNDDRIRDAFTDLTHRTAANVRPTNDPSMNPSLPVGRIAAAGLVVLVMLGAGWGLFLRGGSDNQNITTDDIASDSADAASDGRGDHDSSSDATGSASDDTTDSGPTAEGDAAGDDAAEDTGSVNDSRDRQRLRVNESMVAADRNDPFLNVRLTSDANGELLAKLPPNYRGLRATGVSVVTSDGGNWIEVELLDPVGISSLDRNTGRPPLGWVNEAFVEALPAHLVDDATLGLPCEAGASAVSGTAGAATSAHHVYSLESSVGFDCLRLVIGFGAGATSPTWWELAESGDLPGGAGLSSQLPQIWVTQSGGMGAVIDLGNVASAWSSATDTNNEAFVVRQDDNGLELYVPRANGDVDVIPTGKGGLLVIDVALDPEPTLAPQSLVMVGVADAMLVGPGSVTVSGIARPFEATLDVRIENRTGDTISAVYSGSTFLGTVEASEYGVNTNDWLEAWGQFSVQAEGLAPGQYTLVLSGDGGSDAPDALRIPFAITESGSDPKLPTKSEAATAMAFVDFARSGARPDADLFADSVVLHLGPQEYTTLTGDDRFDRSRWIIDEAEGFGGFEGPFSALERVNESHLRFTRGPTGFCAGAPRQWAAGLGDLQQVNIEPIGISSCIEWFGVHLFFDDQDRIAAVVLDLFGP